MAPDDILFIFGTQKSGTSWLSDIISEIVPVGSQAERWLPKFVSAVQEYLRTHHLLAQEERDAIERRLVVNGWKQLFPGSARCLADKSAYPCVPGGEAENPLLPHALAIMKYYFPQSRQVMITRDPRDVLVSSMYFFKHINFTLSDEFLASFTANWARCQIQWLLSGPTILIRYEDLTRDSPGSIQDIFAALGHDLSPRRCRAIAAKYGRSQYMGNPIFRKGIVGDWKTHLSARHNRLIRDSGREVMNLLGYGEDGPAAEFGASRDPARAMSKLGYYHGIDPASCRLRCDNPDAGHILTEGGNVEFFVIRPGMTMILDGLEVPASPPGYKRILLLVLAMGRQWFLKDTASFSLSIRSAGDQAWRKVFTVGAVGRSDFAFGQPLRIAFEIPAECRSGAFMRVGLFDGWTEPSPESRILEPFRARVLELAVILAPPTSMLTRQISGGAPRVDMTPDRREAACSGTREWTALHFAAQFGSGDVAENLLRHGADPNALAEDGGTPLHRAAHAGRKDIVEALLRHGADPNAVDRQALATPRDIAIRQRHGEVSELLATRGGPRFRDLVASRPDAGGGSDARIASPGNAHDGSDIYIISASDPAGAPSFLLEFALAGVTTIGVGSAIAGFAPGYRISCRIGDLLIGADRCSGVALVHARLAPRVVLPACVASLDARPLFPADMTWTEDRYDLANLAAAVHLALTLGARRIIHMAFDPLPGPDGAAPAGRAAMSGLFHAAFLDRRATADRWWLLRENYPPETPCGVLARLFAGRPRGTGWPADAIGAAVVSGLLRRVHDQGAELVSCDHANPLTHGGARYRPALETLAARTAPAGADSPVIGYVDTIRREDGRLVVLGWSADLDDPVTPCRVVLDHDGIPIAAGRTTRRRDDVLVAYQLPPDVFVGYRFDIPAFLGDPSRVGVYALSSSICRRLPMSDA